MICHPERDRRHGSRQAKHRPVILVSLGGRRCEYAHFGRFKIDEDVMVVVDGMGICVRIATSALEVLSTYKTPVDVDV